MTQWKLAAIACALTTLIAGCGGGGGGGGNPSPATVAPVDGGDGQGGNGQGGNTPTPDMQTGIFSDGPVAGLTYMQGSNAGFTDADGAFSYDANNPAPVQFFLGKVFLGEARGAAVVTPFDLSRSGTPASLSTGYNVSRLLITLDQSAAEGIQLSDQIHHAQGSIDFNVSNGVFELDDDVLAIVERFGARNSLVSPEQVETHLAANDQARQSISELRAQATDAINAVDIRWNPDLDEGGVLAEITASNGEALYLETRSSGSGAEYRHWLSNIFYSHGNGRYLSLTLDENGRPGVVNRNGTLYRYFSANKYVERDFASIDLYRPRQHAFLLSGSGATPITAGPITPGRSTLIQELMTQLTAGSLTDAQFLELVNASLALVSNVMCAEDEAGCAQHARLADYLVLATDDAAIQSTVRYVNTALTPALCTNIALTATSENTCANRNTLHELNVYFGGRLPTFAGPTLLYDGLGYSIIFVYDHPGGAGHSHSTEAEHFHALYSYNLKIYRLDSRHVFVVTDTVSIRTASFGVEGAMGPQPVGPAALTNAVPYAHEFVRKQLESVGRVMTLADPVDVFGSHYAPRAWDFSYGVYLDRTNPPYDRLDLSVFDSQRQGVIDYDRDPASDFYLISDVVPGVTSYERHFVVWSTEYSHEEGAPHLPLLFSAMNFNVYIPGCGFCAIAM